MFLSGQADDQKVGKAFQPARFSATVADARMQVGRCWEAAEAITRIVAPPTTETGYPPLLESLSHVLEALGQLVAVLDSPVPPSRGANLPLSPWQHYADLRASGEDAVLAGTDLIDYSTRRRAAAGQWSGD